MKGDYFRYKTEYSSGEKRNEASAKAHEAYKRASEISEKELHSTHPIRLGLALNYSVYFYEVK